MPSGKTHTLLNLAALPAAVLAAKHFGGLSNDLLAFGAGSFVVATFFLSPDLDLARSRPTYRWKWLAPIWWGYHRIFKHRGLSHSLFLGSLTRVAYLAGIAFLATFAFGAARAWIEGESLGRSLAEAGTLASAWAEVARENGLRNWTWIAASAAGIWLSDCVHILSDRLGSAGKKLMGS